MGVYGDGISTGWFGFPGDDGRRSTKVHVVEDGRPICGARLSARQAFQWCADGVRPDMVECEGCKKAAKRILDEAAKKSAREHGDARPNPKFVLLEPMLSAANALLKPHCLALRIAERRHAERRHAKWRDQAMLSLEAT